MSKLKNVRKSILEAAHGAILEVADYELERVMSNINDVNTEPKKARTITIQLKFQATPDRKKIFMSSSVKSKLEPTNPIETTLFNIKETDDETGEVLNILREALDVAPGQISITGEIQSLPEQIVIGKTYRKEEI